MNSTNAMVYPIDGSARHLLRHMEVIRLNQAVAAAAATQLDCDVNQPTTRKIGYLERPGENSKRGEDVSFQLITAEGVILVLIYCFILYKYNTRHVCTT